MSEREKSKEVSGKVSEVESNGLHLVLDNGKRAFLPKENMHIGKKKKLKEIFSEGFVIRGKIKSQKDGKIILTQKEEKIEDKKNKTAVEKELPTQKKKKNKIKKEQKQQNKIKEENKKELKIEESDQPQKTLKDLKKLQYIGNMKISVGRGKKANLTELSEEKEEEKRPLSKVPEGFLDEVLATTKDASNRFLIVKTSLKERDLLYSEGGLNEE